MAVARLAKALGTSFLGWLGRSIETRHVILSQDRMRQTPSWISDRVMGLSMDDQALAGTVGLVTGASRGIGRALAIGLARHGASIVVSFKSHEAGARETARIITADGGTAEVIGGDLSVVSGARRLVAETAERFGRLGRPREQRRSNPVRSA